jgi:TRAP transporter 4TM/12TM fusion protein
VVPLLVLVAVSYVFLWGRWVEGVFHFRGLSLVRVLYRAYFSGEGLFGMIATISASYVFMFVLFSSFLLKSGGGEFVIRLARTLMGRLTGGPGYIAVMASGLMGTISGSAVANTVSTGSITIPLMQRSGFESKFAAAVCVASSTGGQLMPPIMGAGAFIMAQWTAQPYSVIVGISVLPALLYFASLLFHVYFETGRLGLPPARETDREPLGAVLRDGFHFFIPIAVLVGLLASGYSPTYAAGLAIAAVVASSWLNPRHRMTLKDVADALALGARHMVPIGMLLVCTGLIIGSLNMTGVPIAFSQMVVEWSGGRLLPALALIALASLVLGMGLPVTAAYVMLAVVAVPSLQDMGVSLLAAHMSDAAGRRCRRLTRQTRIRNHRSAGSPRTMGSRH